MIGVGSPYRIPCSAWPDPIVGILGGRDQHFVDAENDRPEYTNVTKMINPADPGGPHIDVDSGTTRACGDGSASTSTLVACDGGDVAFGSNCYHETGGVVDFAKWRKRGFKNLTAIKAWHGRPPFTFEDSDQCGSDPTITTDPPDFKYRTVSRTITNVYTETGGPGSTSFALNRAYTVAARSGLVTNSSCHTDADIANGFVQDQATEMTDLDYVCGAFLGSTDYLTVLNDPGAVMGPWDGVSSPQVVIIDRTVGAAGSTQTLHVKLENHLTLTATATIEVTIVLSDKYTTADVDDDLDYLLGEWPFGDDAIYPFRLDGNCHLSPLVYFNESPSIVSPDVWQDCGWTDTSGYTDDILGLPVPAGYERYFDEHHINIILRDCGSGLFYDTLSIGSFAPDWCPNATRWMTLADGQWGYHGAWWNHGFSPSTVAPGGPFGGRAAKTIWAETIMFAKPSHNFARPCGPNDADAIDQPTASCDEGTGDLTGTLRWPSAADCPEPVTSGYEWNDLGVKGDFVFKAWAYDFRDIAIDPSLRPVTEELKTFTAEQECITWIPCCPSVAVICPDGLDFGWTNAVYCDMPAIVLDEQYGAFWQGRIEQWMRDPLWQVPAQCPTGGDWLIDDGTGTTGQWFPAFEECRTAVPSGAPTYPSGLGVNYTGYVAALNAGGDTIPECEPPAHNVCFDPARPEIGCWNTQTNQEANCTWDIPAVECDDYEP